MKTPQTRVKPNNNGQFEWKKHFQTKRAQIAVIIQFRKTLLRNLLEPFATYPTNERFKICFPRWSSFREKFRTNFIVCAGKSVSTSFQLCVFFYSNFQQRRKIVLRKKKKPEAKFVGPFAIFTCQCLKFFLATIVVNFQSLFESCIIVPYVVKDYFLDDCVVMLLFPKFKTWRHKQSVKLRN